MIPTKEDIEKFKAELSQLSAEEVGQKLRHHTYGTKDRINSKPLDLNVTAYLKVAVNQ
jgi:hypothetical protein